MTGDIHSVFIALGSNLDHRAANLRSALAAFQPRLKVIKASRVYETEPWGYADQPAFLNQVVQAETSLAPEEVLDTLKQMESSLGRTPTFKNGPRVIDLDLLLYDDLEIKTQRLTIPHAGIADRSFVLVPLLDLAPDLVLPGRGETVRQAAERVGLAGVRRVMDKLPLFGLRTYVMGIVNVTPDSFSGDGLLGAGDAVQAAIEQARGFVQAGVDILDVGGESTRPGAQVVGEAEERERVVPVIAALASEFGGQERKVWISVDTYKAEVAEAALDAGADWLNDVWGLRADPRIGAAAARFAAPVILMHNRSKPSNADLQERLGGRYVGVHYNDLVGEVQAELLDSVRLAHEAGIADENIILDPGVGFGKTVDQNLELIDRLPEIGRLGYPVLLGPSRKSFIGYTLNLPPDQRLEGTAAAVSVGIARGADIVRVHDVQFMTRLVRMTDAIVRGR